MAMLTYRTAKGYKQKFGRATDPTTGDFQVKKYLAYQGAKFVGRFDAMSYVKITEQMDAHDVGRNRGGIGAALKSIKAKVLVMGLETDILYPLSEQEELASMIDGSEFRTIKSPDGHDGFLLEQQQVGDYLGEFISK